jgi:enoyl-CoA hydratase/carnithine racemase
VEEDLLTIDYEKRDGVAYITLNNPAKANILDKATSDEISAAWIDLWEDRDIRCAILTGAGDRHFCGGHNLAPRENITPEEREYLRTQRIFWPLAGTVHGQKTGVDGRMGDHYPRVWKPVIAAVNGWAAGAGLYILLASTDIRIASAEHARFKFALTTQGWLGHGPGASLLIKQLRYIDAMKMLLTDDPVDAAEALRIGLVNEVVPHDQLMNVTRALAKRIALVPEPSVRLNKAITMMGMQAAGIYSGLLLEGALGALAHSSHNEFREKLFEAQRQHGLKGYLDMRDGPFQPEPMGPRSAKARQKKNG